MSRGTDTFEIGESTYGRRKGEEFGLEESERLHGGVAFSLGLKISKIPTIKGESALCKERRQNAGSEA